ncbi:translation initiation factor IF-1 [bacterium]|nr:translation initiation factor IF-1 [bacterium]
MARKRTEEKNVIINGEVKEALPNTMFRVELEDGRLVLTTLKGLMRRRYVRIFPGDKVKVELTPYDDERGRIVYKYRT